MQTNHRGRRLLRITAPWVLALVAGSCREPAPPAPSPGQTTPPGETGTPPEPPQPTQPAPWAVGERFHREGYGEGFVLAASDVDGDGSDEVLYGGRSLALVDDASWDLHTVAWELPWPEDGPLAYGGDNEWVVALGTFEAAGGAAPDVLVLDSRNRAHRVEVATGSVVWTVDLELDFTPLGVAMFDANGDGLADFFPSGGSAAWDGATGAKLWDHPMPFPAVHVHAAELDGQPGDEVLVVREIDGVIGGPQPGPEVTVYARAADGALLWEATTPSSPVSAAPADLDGDGLDEAVVGIQEGVVGVGPDGVRWLLPLSDGYPLHVVTTDADGDGRDEAVVAEGWGAVGNLHLVDDDGTLLWSEPIPPDTEVLRLAELDRDGVPEVLVGAGESQTVPVGAVHAFDLVDSGPRGRKLWEHDTHLVPYDLTLAHIDGQDLVVVGGDSTLLVALDPVDGALVREWGSGGFVTAVVGVDLDGDGVDEAVHGDGSGLVFATDDETGEELWRARLEVGADGVVTGLAAGDLDGDGQPEIAATADRLADTTGLVHVLDHEGGTEWFARTGMSAAEPILADLDGDGTIELVVGTNDPIRGCGVAVYEADGATRWETGVASCFGIHLDVGDVDGDGVLEIGYADDDVWGPWQVALLSSDGELRWLKELQRRSSEWVQVVPGAVVHGGWDEGPTGYVTSREAADGAKEWSYRPPTVPDPDDPALLVASASVDGVEVPDRDGDGRSEILVSDYAGGVALLGGQHGAPLWLARTEPEDTSWGDRHTGHVLAYVPAIGDAPPWLALAETSVGRLRSGIFAYDLDGAPLGSVSVDGWGAAAAATSFGAVVGGGLGVTGLQASRVEAEARAQAPGEGRRSLAEAP